MNEPPASARARRLALACLLLGVALALAAWFDGRDHDAGMLLLAWSSASASLQGCARRSRARRTSSTESR